MAKVREEYQLPIYLFHDGTNYKAYEFFGVHKIKGNTYAFRVWAPNAEAVSVVGDFNSWNAEAHRCFPVSPGIWEAIIDNVSVYDCYKYAITAKDGRVLMKADPYAVHQETRPATGSKVYELADYKWKDKKWKNESYKGSILEKPVNIYEIPLAEGIQYFLAALIRGEVQSGIQDFSFQGLFGKGERLVFFIYELDLFGQSETADDGNFETLSDVDAHRYHLTFWLFPYKIQHWSILQI